MVMDQPCAYLQKFPKSPFHPFHTYEVKGWLVAVHPLAEKLTLHIKNSTLWWIKCKHKFYTCSITKRVNKEKIQPISTEMAYILPREQHQSCNT